MVSSSSDVNPRLNCCSSAEGGAIHAKKAGLFRLEQPDLGLKGCSLVRKARSPTSKAGGFHRPANYLVEVVVAEADTPDELAVVFA